MKISPLEEYGVRCALQLGKGFESGPISAAKIAAEEKISNEYVSKIMHLFRKSGIVEARRGIQGGFALSKNPEDVYLLDLFDALKGKKGTSTGFCDQYVGLNDTCVHQSDCSVRPVWEMLSSYFDDVLKEVSIKDLIDKEDRARERVWSLMAKKAEKNNKNISNLSAKNEQKGAQA
jgi:Rrf2 family protein